MHTVGWGGGGLFVCVFCIISWVHIVTWVFVEVDGQWSYHSLPILPPYLWMRHIPDDPRMPVHNTCNNRTLFTRHTHTRAQPTHAQSISTPQSHSHTHRRT